MPWPSEYSLGAGNPLVLDQEYDDFDAQSDRLTGFDQTYLQLTPGRFKGRFVSCQLGPSVSIHIEYCNQAIEQSIGAPQTAYSIGVVLGGLDRFRVNGAPFDSDDLIVVPPGAEMHLISPKGGRVMAVVVDAAWFDQKRPQDHPATLWFEGLGGQLGRMHAPQLADRLRKDAFDALHSVQSGFATHGADRLGEALVQSFLASFLFGWAAGQRPSSPAPSRMFQNFIRGRQALRGLQDDDFDIAELVRRAGRGKRSLQQAFATELACGMQGYLRLSRLHAVRRMLSDADLHKGSIGDLAAQNGFWNWSYFTQAYRAHFDELPSQTRERARLSG